MTNKCKFNYRLRLDMVHSTIQLKSKIAETETGQTAHGLQQWDRSFDRLLHHKFVLGETFLAKHLNASGNFCNVSIDKYQGRGCVYHFVLWESFKAEATLWITIRKCIFCYFWDTITSQNNLRFETTCCLITRERSFYILIPMYCNLDGELSLSTLLLELLPL